jgi:hypothetical protein
MHLFPDPPVPSDLDRAWFQVSKEDGTSVDLSSGQPYTSHLPPPAHGKTWKLFKLLPVTRLCDQKLPKPLPA